MNLLLWFVRSRAGLRAIRRQAYGGHCPCLQWCCAAFRWASEGRYIHSVTRECATDTAGGLFLCHYAHTAAKAPHRLCASSPGSAWAFLGLSGLGGEYGFRWASQGSKRPADISELAEGVPGPFQPDAQRRGTVPVLCPLRECSRIVTAWQRHGRSVGTGRLPA